MISDPHTIEELRELWNAVVKLRSKVHRALLGSATLPNSFAIFMADAAHNLPFVQAFGVLNEALRQIAREKDLTYKGNSLGRLMEASVNSLPWVDYDLILEGKDLRDGVAHRGDVVPRGECWKYIDAVEAELTAWCLLDGKNE